MPVLPIVRAALVANMTDLDLAAQGSLLAKSNHRPAKKMIKRCLIFRPCLMPHLQTEVQPLTGKN